MEKRQQGHADEDDFIEQAWLEQQFNNTWQHKHFNDGFAQIMVEGRMPWPRLRSGTPSRRY